jgi:antitoxin component of MazEF toxin-antitoxin module
METVIRKFGNSKGTLLPASLLKELNLDVNDKIDIWAENGRIVIEPIRKPEYSLGELLASCEPDKMKLNADDKKWLNEDNVGNEKI